MRITSKGQVTIPADIREKAGLFPHTDVEFELKGDTVTIRQASTQGKGSRGERLIAALRSAGTGTMTTDEIMALTRGE
jgi:AbrB family looped-hinge helix DNA binding protein